jgi:UDP-N-acetylglucosamine 2-epimerase (non-hydrolysing)
MKVLTILGTRPEIIRLSRIIPRLDELSEHVVVHTGQNFDANLSEIFFKELGVRVPDHALGVRGETFGEQAGKILVETERVLLAERPDRVLILGDTNSGLSAIPAKRLGIPVYHMEAGNRCYDDRVPEELNRRLIDHASDILMPYTERSRANLLREGLPSHRIYVTGNPIYEVLKHYEPRIARSNAMDRLGVAPRQFMLVTMHRAENVDVESRLQSLVRGLELLQREYQLPIIVSTHPRTQAHMGKRGIGTDNPQVRFLPPFGFFDFVALERQASCVLSDSGTVQEECCILGVPNVTLRDVTERPETIEVGSNILSGAEPAAIQSCVRVALQRKGRWVPPPEYMREDVSGTVIDIVLGRGNAAQR